MGKPKIPRMMLVSSGALPPSPDVPLPPKLLVRLREHLRTRHDSIRTEEAYVDWARRFTLFHGKRHPQDMGAAEVGVFLMHLVMERRVSASTHGQANAAILYLYKQVLGVDLPWLDDMVQAKTSRRLSVVLTPTEARELLLQLGQRGCVACANVMRLQFMPLYPRRAPCSRLPRPRRKPPTCRSTPMC